MRALDWLRSFVKGRESEEGFAAEDARAHTDFFHWKTIFDRQRVGVDQLDPYPKATVTKLFKWSRESDLAYACICKIVEAAQDPDLIVQRRKSLTAPWEAEPGHPLRQLMMRPNPQMTMADFFGCWLASEEVAGEFFAEIERDRRGRPLALHPLDPTCMERAKSDDGWIWKDGYEEVFLADRDCLHSLRRDAQRAWQPLSPLAVALGSVEADAMQSAFVRSFFRGGGVPAGVIKVKGRTLSEEQALSIGKRWLRRFGYGGQLAGAPPVFDENGEYEKVGSNLGEIEGEGLKVQNESRICGVFGVPPLLVAALVGLKFVNQRASANEAQKEFWANKMSATFKRLRIHLLWTLLLEFETEAAVRSEMVRTFWDMANVLALQESMAERSMRAREDFRVGLLTLNRALSILGYPPEENGDYFLRRANQIPISPEALRAQMDAAAAATARAVTLVLTGTSDPNTAAASGTLFDEEDEEKSARTRAKKDCGCGKSKRPRALTKAQQDVGALMDRGRDLIAAQFYPLRSGLIGEALQKLAKMQPGFFHQLVLEWPPEAALALRSTLSDLFFEGQRLVKAEMMAQRDGLSPDLAPRTVEDEALITRTSDVGISRILNEIQSRAVASAARYSLLTGSALIDAIRVQLEGQSDAFLTDAASHVSAIAINAGRDREMIDGDEGPTALKRGRKDDDDDDPDESGFWVYVWVDARDGKECEACLDLARTFLNCDATKREQLPDAPYPDCADGYGKCRCYVDKLWATNFPPRECD